LFAYLLKPCTGFWFSLLYQMALHMRSDALFSGFSWHSSDVSVVQSAKTLIAAAELKGGKSAVSWAGKLVLSDGVYLPWKSAATARSGYFWFVRVLGGLVPVVGNSPSWYVVSHTSGFDPVKVGLVLTALNPTGETDSGQHTVVGTGPVSSGLGIAASSQSEALPVEASSSSNAVVVASAGAAAVSVSSVYRPCLSPALKFSWGHKALAASGTQYTLGNKLGEGSFGEVFCATAHGHDVVVKVLKDGDVKQLAFREAYVLDRCLGHRHIVQLLDVFASPSPHCYFHLVFEPWGCDLRRFLADICPSPRPDHIRDILSQVLSAVGHIHGLGLLHADICPANIFIKSDSQEERFHCKVGDLGSCVEASAVIVYWCSRSVC